MASTPEGRLIRNIARILDQRPGVWWVKLHGHGLQKSGIPDLLVVYRGRAILIEVKAGDAKPSRLQSATMRAIAKAGGVTGIARSAQDVEEMLANVLRCEINGGGKAF